MPVDSTHLNYDATLPALQHDPNRPGDMLKVDADEERGGGCAAVLGREEGAGNSSEKVKRIVINAKP